MTRRTDFSNNTEPEIGGILLALTENETGPDENPADIRGIHKFRFKWKRSSDIINLGDIDAIIMKVDGNRVKYYYRVKKNGKEILREIINIRVLSVLENLSSEFGVTGGKGRRLIIYEIKSSVLGISDEEDKKLLILAELPDWRRFEEIKNMSG